MQNPTRFWAEWVAQNTLEMDYNCILYSIVLKPNFYCGPNLGVKGAGKGMEIKLTDCFLNLCFLQTLLDFPNVFASFLGKLRSWVF